MSCECGVSIPPPSLRRTGASSTASWAWKSRWRRTRMGEAMLDLIFAAYESARTGRKVALPFRPSEGKKPVWLWLRWRETGPRLALHASHQAYGRRIAPLVQAV